MIGENTDNSISKMFETLQFEKLQKNFKYFYFKKHLKTTQKLQIFLYFKKHLKKALKKLLNRICKFAKEILKFWCNFFLKDLKAVSNSFCKQTPLKREKVMKNPLRIF